MPKKAKTRTVRTLEQKLYILKQVREAKAKGKDIPSLLRKLHVAPACIIDWERANAKGTLAGTNDRVGRKPSKPITLKRPGRPEVSAARRDAPIKGSSQETITKLLSLVAASEETKRERDTLKAALEAVEGILRSALARRSA